MSLSGIFPLLAELQTQDHERDAENTEHSSGHTRTPSPPTAPARPLNHLCYHCMRSMRHLDGDIERATVEMERAQNPQLEPRSHLSSPRKAALFLFFFSPVIGELVSGNAPPLVFFGPAHFIFLSIIYGSSALLIRELIVRWGKGWPSLLALGFAYGIVNEGLAAKTFFDPTSKRRQARPRGRAHERFCRVRVRHGVCRRQQRHGGRRNLRHPPLFLDETQNQRRRRIKGPTAQIDIGPVAPPYPTPGRRYSSRGGAKMSRMTQRVPCVRPPCGTLGGVSQNMPALTGYSCPS